jgi:hypothetical protein
MIRGSCLCRAIRYEIEGPIGEAGHCHCSMCRKAHGAAFGTYARVAWRDFKLLEGADQITRYASSPGIERSFCRRCGSTLQYLTASTPDTFALALGTLDDDPGVRPTSHIFVNHKAPWFEITDRLRQYPEWD